MSETMSVIFIGIGATVVMDLWGLIRKKLFDIPLANYGLVGRWIAYMIHGQFYHESISNSPMVRYEAVLGWFAHYWIGIVFAMGLLAISGGEWLDKPTLLSALLFGLVTVLAPFLLMQPGMGAGVAASRTSKPGAARLQSLITHLVFGLGLYIAAFSLNYISSN